MTVRTVFCEFCRRLGDFRGMFMCPACRRTICRHCAVEPPFPPKVCINAKKPCPGVPHARPNAPEGSPAP